MLIINADDLGRSKPATDTALACHGRNRITSASAMVYMADSVRAAKLALDAGLDVGLHVNLSEEFSSPSASHELRRAHDQIRIFLKANKYALVLYNPALTRQFKCVFEAQLGEFLRLFGRPPSHFDGHQHFHLATNMLVQRVLPAGTKVRRSFSFRPGEKGFVNRYYRRAVDRAIMRQHRVTSHFFSLSDYLVPDRLARVVALADQSEVELMAHPERQVEFDFLMSDAFAEALSRVKLASYEAL